MRNAYRRSRNQRQPEMYILFGGATITSAVVAGAVSPTVSIAIIIAGTIGIALDMIATKSKGYRSIRSKRLSRKVETLRSTPVEEITPRLASYCYRNRFEIENLVGFYTTEIETILVEAPRTPKHIIDGVAKGYVDWLEYDWARLEFYPIPQIDAKAMGLLIAHPKTSLEDRNDIFDIITTRDPSPVVLAALWDAVERNPDALTHEQKSRLTVLTALG